MHQCESCLRCVKVRLEPHLINEHLSYQPIVARFDGFVHRCRTCTLEPKVGVYSAQLWQNCLNAVQTDQLPIKIDRFTL